MGSGFFSGGSFFKRSRRISSVESLRPGVLFEGESPWVIVFSADLSGSNLNSVPQMGHRRREPGSADSATLAAQLGQ
jgi:hypothetical protein